MSTPRQSRPSAPQARRLTDPPQANELAAAPVASRSSLAPGPLTDAKPELMLFVRALARGEARQCHRRALGFGLPETALIMIVMAAMVAAIMLTLRGRLPLPW